MWIDTGRKDTSGTGKNQKVTRIVDKMDLLTALPFDLKARAGEGLELELHGSAASQLWRETRDEWVYRCTLEEFPGDPILQVAEVGKVVGSLLVNEAGGVIAVLPEPWIPDEDFEDEDEDQPDKGLGNEPKDDPEGDSVDRFRVPKAIATWMEQVGAAGSEPLPAWCADLLLETEVSRSAEIAEVENALAELTARMGDLRLAQAEDEQWKRLIASSGVELERQTQAAFEFLGFEVLEARQGRGDLRLSRGQARVVVEVKGVSKSAAEKNAAQLEKWVAEELADDTTAKGVLVVNGWREKAPKERREVFPAQMQPYSEARGHCLVTGLQLLAMCEEVRRDESKRDEVAELLLTTVGTVPGFDHIEQILSERPADQATN